MKLCSYDESENGNGKRKRREEKMKKKNNNKPHYVKPPALIMITEKTTVEIGWLLFSAKHTHGFQFWSLLLLCLLLFLQDFSFALTILVKL